MRILCIVDSYRWALSNRANSLKKHIPQYKFLIKHFDDLKKINFDNYDIVYSLNWPIHGYIKNKISKDRKYKLLTTICSHIGRPNAAKMTNLFKNYDAISTSNNMLYKEFRGVYGKKVFNTQFGVESELFVPRSIPSKYKNIFGWVGNNERDVKRFKDIERAFKLLGSKYKLKTATHRSGLSRSKMVEFYNSVGTVICFSKSEGTPNPILEAASCGRAVISTRVGNAPELLSGVQNNLMVNDLNQLRKRIVSISGKNNNIDHIGRLLRKEVVKNWGWNIRSRAFLEFFNV